MVVGCILQAEPLTHVSQAVVDQVAYELVRRVVVSEPALVACGDEAHHSQQRKLVTGNGQRQIERAREVPDRQLVMRERVHEREPDWVREQLEDLRGFRERLRVGETASGRPDLLSADDFGQRALRLCYHS